MWQNDKAQSMGTDEDRWRSFSVVSDFFLWIVSSDCFFELFLWGKRSRFLFMVYGPFDFAFAASLNRLANSP